MIPSVIDLNGTKTKLSFTIKLNASEILTMDETTLLRKVQEFEHRAFFDKGYIVKIHKIIEKGYGILIHDSCVEYKVIVLASVINPRVGDVLTGCKLVRSRSKAMFMTWGKNIFAIRVEHTRQEEKKKLYSVQLLSRIFNVNKPKYKLLVKEKSGGIKTILANNIVEDNWIQLSKQKNKSITIIDYNNNQISIKTSTITVIMPRVQIIAEAKLFNMYDLPFRLRYIKIARASANLDGYKMAKYENFDHGSETELWKIDHYLFETVAGKRKWSESLRLLTNPYELVPHKISRAYNKSREITNIFMSGRKYDKGDILITIGDAPGGWAFQLRETYPENMVISTSLKKGIQYSGPNNGYKVDFMKLGDGDLLKRENIEYMIGKYGGKVSLIGCDAALGYYRTVNNLPVPKELIHTRLLLSEIAICLGVQKVGGSAFIKMYGISRSLPIFQILTKYYESVYIYKAMSSRISNSEMFIIMKNFNGINPTSLIETIKKMPVSDTEYIKLIDVTHPTTFHTYMTNMSKLELFTRKYGYYVENFDSVALKLIQTQYAQKFEIVIKTSDI